MRSKKTGSDLELFVMASFSKMLKELPQESRERVVNWVASRTWNEDTKPVTPVQVSPAALS
jgi:hypothetical protein